MSANKGRLQFHIKEVVDNSRRMIAGVVEADELGMTIKPDGYVDPREDFGGAPIVLEIADGKLRLLVWADRNEDEPTHTISLEGARRAAK